MPAVRKVELSRHAALQMRERGIPAHLVLTTLEYPDRTTSQTDGTRRSAKRVKRNGKDYALVVVHRELVAATRVVTVFFTSKVRKYLTR